MSQSRNRHALIVEDEMVAGLGLQYMLETFGFGSFAFASTADQAMEQAELRLPDLVTLDMNLLVGDGTEVARRLAGAYGAVATLYVTGNPAAARAVGGAEVIQKPFGELELGGALRRMALWEGLPDPVVARTPPLASSSVIEL